MFHKRRRRMGTALNTNGPTCSRPREPEHFVVNHEDMLKGAEVTRHNKRVRQFAVMVRGAVRVVTSGDTVDRETYEALLTAGAIKATSSGGEAPSAAAEPAQEGD